MMRHVAALALGAASVASRSAAYDGNAIGRFNANATNEDWAGHAVLALAFSDAAALDEFVGAPAQLELLSDVWRLDRSTATAHVVAPREHVGALKRLPGLRNSSVVHADLLDEIRRNAPKQPRWTAACVIPRHVL